MCDWCQGGASDLVYNKQGNARGEIDEETGVMTITMFPGGDMPPLKAGE